MSRFGEPAVYELRLGALLVQEAELLRFVSKLVAEIGMGDADKALCAGRDVGPAQIDYAVFGCNEMHVVAKAGYGLSLIHISEPTRRS